nr:Uncharacterised protein [Ipomoea batatas]
MADWTRCIAIVVGHVLYESNNADSLSAIKMLHAMAQKSRFKAVQKGDYSSSAISLTKCSTAFCSSSPSAERVTTVPWVRPSVCSLNRLLALADLPLEVTVISDWKALASLTNCAAGRLDPLQRRINFRLRNNWQSKYQSHLFFGKEIGKQGGTEIAFAGRGENHDDIFIGTTCSGDGFFVGDSHCQVNQRQLQVAWNKASTDPLNLVGAGFQLFARHCLGNDRSRNLSGSLATISSALEMAPFMPFAPSQLAPLNRHGIRHGERQFIAACRRHIGQRDAGVAARRLNQFNARLKNTAFFRVPNHIGTDTAFHTEARVTGLHLRQDAAVTDAVQSNQRRATSKLRTITIDPHCRCATNSYRHNGQVNDRNHRKQADQCTKLHVCRLVLTQRLAHLLKTHLVVIERIVTVLNR